MLAAIGFFVTRGGGEEAAPAVVDPVLEGHARMVAELREIADRTDAESPYLGSARATEMKEAVRLLERDAVGRRPFELNLAAGLAEVRLGNLESGIEYLTRANELAPAAQLAPDEVMYARFKLGVAYMRLGETQNCCANTTPESCIVPIRGGGLHARTEGSTRAIELFQEVLDTGLDGEFERTLETTDAAGAGRINAYLASRWLLNIAYMTLGEYPSEVPEDQLIPPSTFESEVPIPHFRNIAQDLGVNTFDLSGGAIVDDFDNDGYLDLVTSTWDPRGPLQYFRNEGDGSFSNRTEGAGLGGLLGGLNLAQADYDNDGHLDFLVLRGAWLGAAGRHPNSLIRNNGDGTFTDVTYAAGLGRRDYPTQTGAWADYDNDGDLDVFIGNEYGADISALCQLFRNNGDGTFTDVAGAAGVHNYRYTKGATWGDYDGDRFADLYVSNLHSANRLYRNNGDGTFTDVAKRVGVAGPSSSFPAWFWDFDNDGALDLFVSSYAGRVDHLTAHYVGQQTDYEKACLYRGDGQGSFTDVARQQGLGVPMLPMGSNFGDLDNDGFLDFYLGTGDPDYESLMPNMMFLNRGGTGFDDVTMAGGFGHLQKGHAVAFADLDNDGDADVFEQMGGAVPGDRYENALFENPGFGNHWIGVQLVGVTSNRSAIGARIQVTIYEERPDGGAPARREVYRHVNSGGSFGANPLRQTIGLGSAEQLDLEVFWPVTGRTQTLRDLAADQVIRIVEDEEGYERIVVEQLELGG